jgi:hypothetical protein
MHEVVLPTYFLSTGWRRYGLIGIDEVPGGGDE